MAARSANHDGPNGAALFEAANKLRGSVESSEYKHLVLGLLFLKYISDAFEQRRQSLEAELSDPRASDAYIEDPAERALRCSRTATSTSRRTSSGFPRSARWPALLAAASQPDIAKRIDDALERDRAGEPRAAQRAAARLRPRAAVGRADGLAGGDDREDRLRRGPEAGARHPRAHL